MGKIMYNGKPYSGSFDKAVNVTYDNSNSGLASKNVQAATDEVNAKANKNANDIGTLNTKMIYYIDAQIVLSNLTWATSGSGLVYSNDFDATNGVAKTILSVTETGFSNIRATDVIKPFISTDGKKIRFMSNVNTFHSSSSLINVRVVYLK